MQKMKITVYHFFFCGCRSTGSRTSFAGFRLFSSLLPSLLSFHNTRSKSNIILCTVFYESTRAPLSQNCHPIHSCNSSSPSLTTSRYTGDTSSTSILYLST